MNDIFRGITAELEENHNGNPIKPERNLLAAVMARAICDAFGAAHCEKHIVRAARTWIFSKLAPKRPFSFAWVALQLDLSPEALQNRLKVMSHEELQERISILRN